MFKKAIGIICALSLVVSFVGPYITSKAVQSGNTIIEDSDIPLRLHYDEEAPYGNENASEPIGITEDDGWERWSLPIGNGYFGANVFGRTETERIQITEKTLANPYYKTNPNTGRDVSLGGLNNFSETYIDIGHPQDKIENYSRWLDLKTAIAGVEYEYKGVTYSREVFTSYPDKALVIRLDASEEGALDFVLRPTIPWEQEYAAWEGDKASKEGEVVSYIYKGEGIIELSGKMSYYGVDFLGLYKVVTDGGTVSATTCINADGDTDGTITVNGAKSAYIYVTLGTDYELSEDVFDRTKTTPTALTTLDHTRIKVEGEFNAIAKQLKKKGYEEAYATLKNNHLEDYTELFGRVSVDLGDAEDAALTTDELVNRYQNGDYSAYLDMLYFQYGRYLLIASSRSGALPANLQGTWNRYNKSPWGSGLWHNLNEQMNYWPTFSTNLAETFDAYIEYNQAYMKQAEIFATSEVKKLNPEQEGMDGGNGWVIGTNASPYQITTESSSGNLGFLTQIFWEYYQYTQDKQLLEEVIFPVLISAARFIVKSVEMDEEGNYLAIRSDSPEMYVNGVWYYTQGTTYAQSFAYQNNYNALLAAKELGIDLEDSSVLESDELCVLKRIMEQIDKYDPVNIGLSGQIKEFRQEDYYSSMGDEPTHRHVSQLVGCYPGNIINATTPAWLDAVATTLDYRGDESDGWGWGMAHRACLWARTKNGERAYELMNLLLSTNTATNLWNINNPYQIDGNFGGTAAISEMLLQSHEGYIAPLAAIPTAWEEGSYTGLVARGNFEVSAAWKNGLATAFNITSQCGGTVSVNYSGITTSKVLRASDGKEVDYTISGTDIISFETKQGETYIITGLRVTKTLSTPTNVSVATNDNGHVTLSWDLLEGAKEYRVYVAIEDQADYTLVATTTDTKAVYIPESGNENLRTTIKVVAVDEYGTESKGEPNYKNPLSDTHTHTLKQVKAKSPTCTTNGWKVHQICLDCEYSTIEIISATGHSESKEWSYDDELHWKTCVNDVDEKIYVGGHVFDDENDTSCDCGYTKGAGHQHTYTVTDYDDESHWKKCKCGAVDESSKNEHLYEDVCDSDCDCGYERTAPHNYKTTYESDETQHWIICSNCGLEKENSKGEHGGVATCVKPAACPVCGVSHGTVASDAHVKSDTWKSDREAHWKMCQNEGCTEEFDKEKHNFKDGRCTECGVEKTVNTGDAHPLGIWIVLPVISGIIVVGLVIYRYKKGSGF